MTKSKFVLTQDLIKVQSEPQPVQSHTYPQDLKSVSIERLSLNIDSALKKRLHLFCAHERKNMTSIVEVAIKQYLDNNLK